MFFFGNSSIKNEEEDDIEILVSRLEHSEYLEDKMDALYELKKYASKNILETGTYGLLPLIESINKLQDISYNLKILHKIFSSEYFDEFVDLLIKDNQNVNIILSNRKKDHEGVYNLFKVLVKSYKFCKVFVTIRNSAHYCVKQIEYLRLEILNSCLNLDKNFDKEVVFEGVFEKLLDIKEYRLIKKLLKNNHFNQNYFIESDWNKHPENIDTLGIFCYLIDNTNNNINYIKDSVYKYIKFKCTEEYSEYIYNMIVDNKKYLDIFYEMYHNESIESVCMSNFINNNIDNNIEDNNNIDNMEGDCINNNMEDIKYNMEVNNIENNCIYNNMNNCIDNNIDNNFILIYYLINKKIFGFKSEGFNFLICSEILKYYSSNLIEESINYSKICKKSEYNRFIDFISYNSGTVSHILLLMSFRNIDHKISISIDNLNRNTIIYFIILSNPEYIKENASVLFDKINTDIDIKDFCIFLCILYDVNINYNRFYKIKFLKDFRKCIINDDIIQLDEALNLLLDKINELLSIY